MYQIYFQKTCQNLCQNIVPVWVPNFSNQGWNSSTMAVGLGSQLAQVWDDIDIRCIVFCRK